jgi:hypothetical protein
LLLSGIVDGAVDAGEVGVDGGGGCLAEPSFPFIAVSVNVTVVPPPPPPAAAVVVALLTLGLNADLTPGGNGFEV